MNEIHYCVDCGTALSKEDQFCGTCGAKVELAQPDSEAAPAKCSRCSAPLSLGESFCGECGKKVSITEPIKDTYHVIVSAPNQKKGRKKSIAIVFIILFLIGCAFAVFYSIQQDDIKQQEKVSTAAPGTEGKQPKDSLTSSVPTKNDKKFSSRPPNIEKQIRITMAPLKIGSLPGDVFAQHGVWIIQGNPAIYKVNAAMVVPNNESKVLIAGGNDTEPLLGLMFDPPVSEVWLTRIGVQGGSSLPKWRMEVIDGQDNMLQARSEWEFGSDPKPREVKVKGQDITQVFVFADNRWNGGTYATFNFPPIVSISIKRSATE